MIPGLPTMGGMELIIILVVVLLLFGAKRIPGLARSLGTGVREFRQGVSEKNPADKEGKVRELEKEGKEPPAQEEEKDAPSSKEEAHAQTEEQRLGV